MDYSTADADDHHGASPWASSPQQNRFGSEVHDVPPSPLPAGAQYDDSLNSRPATADSEAQVPIAAAPVPAAENGESRQRQETQQEGAPATQARVPAGQRYKGQGREKRPQPQYRLTAKVTGLERNGRKDPILRFDVYVWELRQANMAKSNADIIDRQTFPSSVPLSSAMSAAHMANSSNSKNILYPRILKPSFLLCPRQ